MTIRIYYLGNDVAGYYDMEVAHGGNPLSNVTATGYFDIDGNLGDSYTLANINVSEQTADIVPIPDISEPDSEVDE